MTNARFAGHDRSLILLGGGGHAAVVADAARRAGWNLAGFVSDAEPTLTQRTLQQRGGLVWLGTITSLAELCAPLPGRAAVFPAVGDGSLREQWIARAMALGFEVATIAHPTAVLADSASIEHGTFIGPQAVVGPRAAIGAGVIINTSAIVEHDCEIGAYAHVAPGSVLTGGVIVGRMAMIGARAVVVPERVIGDGAVVGAGAVVTQNVAPSLRVAGCPAKPIVAHAGQSMPPAVQA